MASHREGAAVPDGPSQRPAVRKPSAASTERPAELTVQQLNAATEEILTVNNQLADKVHELLVLNDDLANLIESTDVATVFLDTQLQIKRFTATAASPFNLNASDVGRSIGQVSTNLNIQSLEQDC